MTRIPHDEFERLVESDNPPTISALEKLGTRHTLATEREAAEATKLLGAIRRSLVDAQEVDLDLAALGLGALDRAESAAQARRLARWLVGVANLLKSE